MKTKTALADFFEVLEIHGILEPHQKADFQTWKSIFMQIEKNQLHMAYLDGKTDVLADTKIDFDKYFDKTFTNE